MNPAPADSPPSGRAQRIRRGATLLAAGRITSAVCGLVQVPIALGHLGAEAFGLWVALTGLLWSLSILDCGIGFAVQNRLAALLAGRREPEAAALLRRAVRLLAAIGALALLLSLPLLFWGHWPDWLGVTDPVVRGETLTAVGILFVAGAINLPLQFAARVATAAQHTWMIGLWTIVASVLGLGAVAAAAWTGAPLAGFMLAACVLPLGPHVGVWLQLRATQGWMKAGAGTATELRGLGKESALFFMPQLGSVFIGSFVPPLIAFFAGPAAVASYSVLQRLFGLALQVQGLVLMPTWPAYTQAAATGDASFARRTYKMSWLVTVAGFALPTLLLTPLVPAFVHVWLGDPAPVLPISLLWALSGWHVLQYLGQPQAILLNGTGRLQRLVLSVWLCLSLSLWLSQRWGPVWGAEGVILALAAPYALLNLPVISWEAAKALGLIREGEAVRPPQPTT